MRNLEIYERTDVLAHILFSEILWKKLLKQSESNSSKYDYTPEYYITQAEALEFLENKEELKRDLFRDEIVAKFYQVIVTSGIMNLAFDEYHSPPLDDIGLDNDIIDMIRYSMAVFARRDSQTVTKEEISDLINENIDEFSFYNKEVFEGLKIKNETVDIIYNYLSDYFFTK